MQIEELLFIKIFNKNMVCTYAVLKEILSVCAIGGIT